MYKSFNKIEQWELKLAIVLSITGTLTLIATAIVGILMMGGLILIPN